MIILLKQMRICLYPRGPSAILQNGLGVSPCIVESRLTSDINKRQFRSPDRKTRSLEEESHEIHHCFLRCSRTLRTHSLRQQ